MNSKLADAWQRQITSCEKAGSPFTARVLEAAWNDWREGGTLHQLLPDWPRDAWIDAVALRVAGALHSLVLEGVDPALAAIYPPGHTAFDSPAASEAIRNAIRVHRDRIADYLLRPPQTNEVGRSAVLLGGFGLIAQRTGLPLATREIGASAGLNLLWHRYRYELGATTWGDPASPVIIRADWQGTPPPLPTKIGIASWHGCDVSPIALDAPNAATRLASYVWADQHERLQRLQAAIMLAKAERVSVESADAVAFLTRELARPRDGETTVVYHSIVWQYLSADTRRKISALIEEAGMRATPQAPLAWLALEVPDSATLAQLQLTFWPGNERLILADAHPHGVFAHWFPQAA